MAGIIYRTCEFDDKVGVAVAAYRTGVTSRHKSFRSQVAATTAVVAQGTAIASLNASLLALMKLYGIKSIDSFREALGLGARFSSVEDAELWILDMLGIALVNGMYVCQNRKGIKLAAYRTVYEVVGLTTLEYAMALGEDGGYTYYIEYDGTIWTDTSPRVVALETGVAVAELTITFVWFESTTKGVRNELRLAGFPRDTLYHIVRGNSKDNVSTVILPRLDMFDALRSMGYTTADITAVLDRTAIRRVLIDSTQTRDDDSTTAITGIYQPTPYPGELARFFHAELNNLPSVGQLRASSGARIYRMPATTVMLYLDADRSFPTTAYTRKVADEREEVQGQGSQAILAAVDVNSSEVQRSITTLVGGVKDFANDAAEVIETVWAFFGVDIACGRADPEGWPDLGKIDPLSFPDLFDKVSLASDDFSDLFGLSVSQMATSNSLLAGLVGMADTLTCGAVNLDCMAEAAQNADDLLYSTSDGGYDEAGNIAVAMFDTEDVASALGGLLSASGSDFGDFANAMYAAGGLLNQRKTACSQDSSIAQVQGLMDAATESNNAAVVAGVSP